MSIPASYIETLRDRVSIAETIGRRIAFDPQKSIPGKGDFWACCPFHGEKTPSFHVLDRQGFFYCFGCHEKGSAIDFVMKHDNLSFPEAVEVLAREIGMAPPEKDRREARRQRERASLSEALEAAIAFYREQLDSAAGRAARDYLAEQRGLTRETIERFEIGYAPAGWEAAREALSAQGFDEQHLLSADICGRSEKTGKLYDRFRDRIMFPIRDARGRAVGFGGRAMLADERTPKYLNSRETELFDKGRTLFNLDRAERRLGRNDSPSAPPLMVVEGYMDVIALAQSGFETAVAPLGTALTEHQLQILWRYADEPVLALDGDAAGQRAAERAAMLALPRLSPGKSLSFAALPEGQDPDDLVKKGGAQAIEALLGGAEPMIDLLWRLSAGEARIDTPERRAALEQNQRELVDRIEDKTVRRRYGDAFYERRRRFFFETDRAARNAAFRRGPRQPGASAAARAAALREAAESADPAVVREGAILLLLLDNIALWDHRSDQVEELDLFDPALDSVKNALLSGVAAIEDEERAAAEDPSGTPRDLAARQEALDRFVDRRLGAGLCSELRERLKKRLGGPFSGASRALDAVCRLFDQMLEAHRAEVTWRREIDAYRSELLDGGAPDEAPRRLQEAQRMIARSQSPAAEESAEANSASGKLKKLVDSQPWVKKRPRGDDTAA